MPSSLENYRIGEQPVQSNAILDNHLSTSIIVPTYNGAPSIGHCLQSILSQPTFGPLQIIVIDDRSSDNTASIIKSYVPEVTFLENDTNKGMSATWNLGVERADGEIVVFIDQDCIARDDWLTKLTSRFLTCSDTQVVQGNFYMQYFDTPISRYHARWRRSVYIQKHAVSLDSDKICFNTINTRNVAIKKILLMEVKKNHGEVFNEQNSKGGGDLELGRRLYQMGIKILFEETAEVRHQDPISLQGILNQKYGHAYFAAQAGFSERLFDIQNFQRVVINPMRDGVPIWFSLLIWCASMYGFQKGLQSSPRIKR